MKKSLRRIKASLMAMTAVASFAAAPLANAGVTFELPSLTAFAADSDVLVYEGYSYKVTDDGIPEKTVIKGYFSSTAKHYAITYERDFLSIGTYTIGDVNEDGMIDSSDASMILAEYALIQIGSESSLTEAQRIAADVNRDYSVDSTDASKILAYYAKVSTGQDATLE